MDLCQDSQDFSDYSSILSSEKDLTSSGNFIRGYISINIALLVNIPFYRSNYIDVQRITINIDKYLRYITLFNGWKFIENLSQG